MLAENFTNKLCERLDWCCKLLEQFQTDLFVVLDKVSPRTNRLLNPPPANAVNFLQLLFEMLSLLKGSIADNSDILNRFLTSHFPP